MSSEIPNFATNIQHQEPSVYYCYKFWLSKGEVREGCTDVLTTGQWWGLDLNEYGWVYMTIPIVGLFMFVLVFCALCESKESNGFPSQQSSSKPRVLSRSSSRNRLYSVVPINSISQKKRIYPSLNSRKVSIKKPPSTKPTVHIEKQLEAEGLLEKENFSDPKIVNEVVTLSVHSEMSSKGSSQSAEVFVEETAE